jgi:hypothetical protein
MNAVEVDIITGGLIYYNYKSRFPKLSNYKSRFPKLSRRVKKRITRSRKRNRKQELLYLGNHRRRWQLAYALNRPKEFVRKLTANSLYGKFASDSRLFHHE